MHKIFLVFPELSTRADLSVFIEKSGSACVVGTAGSLQQAKRRMAYLAPDCILLSSRFDMTLVETMLEQVDATVVVVAKKTSPLLVVPTFVDGVMFEPSRPVEIKGLCSYLDTKLVRPQAPLCESRQDFFESVCKELVLTLDRGKSAVRTRQTESKELLSKLSSSEANQYYEALFRVILDQSKPTYLSVPSREALSF